MTHNKKLITLTSLFLINTATYAAPSNEELFKMIMDLKKEVADSKNRESDLKTNLEKTTNELIVAKKQLNELPKSTLVINNKALAESQEALIPNEKEGFTVSAGALVVTQDPNSSSPYPYLYYGNNGSNGNYDAGFQVSGSYQSKNNWDYALKFKNFNSNYSSSTYGYSSKTNNQMNILDLEIGKLFSITNNVGIRVAGGVRSAISTFSSTYSYTVPYYYPSEYSYKTTYFGVGPRVTGTPIWKPFSNDFRVFGNFGASFLMGSTGNNSAQNLILEAGSGIGYTIKTNPYNIDLQTGYQLENWGTAGNNLQGYHGPYANVGVKF